MITSIEGIEPGILGIEMSGRISDDDYKERLIPLVEGILARGEKPHVLIRFADDFAGYRLHALWDDTVFGIRHWHDIPAVALVGAPRWIEFVARLFSPFWPGEFRFFAAGEENEARAWLAALESGQARPAA